jgi:hypothetical protein
LSFKHIAIECLSFEKGTTTLVLETIALFFILIIMFEIGSVTIVLSRLPRTLTNTWDHTFVGKLTETDTTKSEVTHVAVTTTAAEAAVDLTCTEFWRLLRTRYR